MDKKLAGLLGAAAALTTMSAAQAAPAIGPELPQTTSYRDLLDPIPNLALAEGRRSTSGTERRHPDRPGCDRASSSPSPSRRSRLCPRRAASPSPPSPSPSSPSRLLMTHKGICSDALISMKSARMRGWREGSTAGPAINADCRLIVLC
jgi:hypothetical protein